MWTSPYLHLHILFIFFNKHLLCYWLQANDTQSIRRVQTKAEKFIRLKKEYAHINLDSLFAEEVFLCIINTHTHPSNWLVSFLDSLFFINIIFSSQQGVHFNNTEVNIEWLPLQYYDDVTLEQLFIDGTINFDEIFTDPADGTTIPATARVIMNEWMHQNESNYNNSYNVASQVFRRDDSTDDEVVWMSAEIIGYNEAKEKFRCLFSDGAKKLVPRLFVCFDIEDPQ